MDKLPQQSPDITQQNIDRIATLFPSAITETKDADGKLKKAINFTTLKQLLSADVVDGDECYEFTWVGKKQSIIEGNRPIRKTLRPAKDESKNWDTTENLYIEGDNLEVLKMLQNSYLNSIKMIYIDPPYNTGNDFVYRDNFAVSKEDYEGDLGVFDEDDNRLFKNTETNGRYHSDWCSMMYPRLQLARNLMKDDGVIFISIDDNEVDNLRKICDEVFGEGNFVNCITINMNSLSGVKMTHAISGKRYPAQKEYILLYKKSDKPLSLLIEKKHKGEWDKEYNLIIPNLKKNQFEEFDGLNNETVNEILKDMVLESLTEFAKNNSLELSDEWKWENAYRIFGTKSNTALVKKLKNEVFTHQIVCYTNTEGNKRFFRSDYNKDVRDPRIELVQAEANSSIFLSDNWIDISNDGGVAQEGGVIFPNGKKPLALIKRIINASNSNDGTILDFFSGSSTTAHAVMQLNAEDGGNRKFIMVQLPEKTDEKSEAYKAGYKNICEIGKERIRRAGKKIEEELQAKSKNGGLFAEQEDVKAVDTGFRVLKLDDTNMKDVYYSAGEYSQQMLLDLESNIKEDRTDLDLLFGVMLDWGVPLSLPHITEVIGGKQVHFVNGTDLVACFEENITETVVREIAKRKPLRVVFRDSSFGSSPEKINVSEIFKTLSGDTTIKVI